MNHPDQCFTTFGIEQFYIKYSHLIKFFKGMKYLSPSGYSPLEDESVELKTVTGECQSEQDADEEFNDQLQSPEVSIVTSESSLQIFLEMLFPFIFGT